MPLRRFFLKTRIFGTARLAVDDADDLDVGDIRRAGEHFAAFFLQHQNLIDRDFVAAVASKRSTVMSRPGETLTCRPPL